MHLDNANALQPVSTDTQQARVLRELTRGIMSGAFAPGEEISIRNLCQQLGAGVMPVREAVQRMVGQGAFEALANRTLRVPGLSQKAFEELTLMRRALEPIAAALACEHADAQALETITRLHQTLRERVLAGAVNESLELNRQLHFAIYGAAQAPILLATIENLWLRQGPLLRVIFSTAEIANAFEAIWSEHVTLHAALMDRSARKARRALDSIIALSSSWLTDHYAFAPLPSSAARAKVAR